MGGELMDRTEGALVLALITIVALGGLFAGRVVNGTVNQNSQNQIVVLAKNQAFTTDSSGRASLTVNVPVTNFKDGVGGLIGNMDTGLANATQVTVVVTGVLQGSYCADNPSSCVTVPLGGGNGRTSAFTGMGNTVEFAGALPSTLNTVTLQVSVNCAKTSCANVSMSFTLLLVGRGS